GTIQLTLGGSSAGLPITVGGSTVTIQGTVKGTFSSSSFSISNSVTITVPGLGALGGSMRADNSGIAACAVTSSGVKVGFEYYWQSGAVDLFTTKGCSEAGF